MDRLVMKKNMASAPPLDYANKTDISKLLNFIMETRKVFLLKRLGLMRGESDGDV